MNGCDVGDCIELVTESVPCTGDSPVDCVYNEWSDWSNCSHLPCREKGKITRTRDIGYGHLFIILQLLFIDTQIK